MKTTIESDDYTSCGSCEGTRPKVFELDEQTKSSIAPSCKEGRLAKGRMTMISLHALRAQETRVT